MAQATYFNTAKRRNSTLVPSFGTEATLHLKEATSLLNPTFLLTADTVPAISEILFMGRYYFVDNIRSVRNGVWEIDCSVDVLATYKSQILAQSAFVVYSSTLNNPNIIDDRIQRTVETIVSNTGNGGTLDRYSDLPRYILQVIGTGGASISGFTTSYLMTQAELSQLANAFFTDTDLLAELKQYFANYFDCIIACYRTNWIPPTSGSSEIKLGNYSTGITAELITSTKTRDVVTISIPWGVNDYRKSDCSIKILLPYIGCVELSGSDFFSQNAIDIVIDTEWNTGNILYRIQSPSSSETAADIATFPGNVFAQIPVSHYGVEGGSAIATFGGNFIGNLVARGAQGIANFLTQANTSDAVSIVADKLNGIAKSTAGIIGGFGNTAVGGLPAISVYTIRNPRNIEPSDSTFTALWGRPYYNVVSNLTNLSGYLQCADYSFSGICMGTERQAINNLLNGGIYIE